MRYPFELRRRITGATLARCDTLATALDQGPALARERGYAITLHSTRDDDDGDLAVIYPTGAIDRTGYTLAEHEHRAEMLADFTDHDHDQED